MRKKWRNGLLIVAALAAGALFGCTAQHEPRPAAIHANGTVLVVRADRFD